MPEVVTGWLAAEANALVLRGLWLTVILTAITTATSMLLGLVIGSWRLSPTRGLRLLATLFVEVHRNVPALVLVIFWDFAVPNLFPPSLRQAIFFDNPLAARLSGWIGLPLVYYAFAAALALTLNTSAYVAELFRAGVGAIAQEIVDAARILGATRAVVYWTILLPQGVRVAFPAISARLVHNMKNTSLAAFVAVPELFHSTEAAIALTFQATHYLLLSAALYLLLGFGLTRALWAVERLLAPRPPAEGELTAKAQRPVLSEANGTLSSEKEAEKGSAYGF
jgi:polar amino acid transport system permease protein